MCGEKECGTLLTIHHILFPGFRYREDKRRDTAQFLIVLCDVCHQWYHRFFLEKEIPINYGRSEFFCKFCGREDISRTIKLEDYLVPGARKSIKTCVICRNAIYNHHPKFKGGGWYR